jgi:hypothetical protein
MKNPHAVALGRLGGKKGGQTGGTARAAALSPDRRRQIAREAAEARWAPKGLAARINFPESVGRLLKSYDLASLRWERAQDRWAIASAVLVRGSSEARGWLTDRLSWSEQRDLAARFNGAGLNEPERIRLRELLSLTVQEIPERAFLGMLTRRSR